MNELEAMRSQMQILKRKLEDQELVNDRLLRNAMSGKMSWVTKYVWFELLVLFPFCVVVFSANKLMYPTMSWAPTVVILIFTFFSALADIYVNRVSASDWQSENLLQTAGKLVRMKKLRWWQVAVSLPVIIPLFWWYFLEFPDAVRVVVTIGGIVGGIIGFSVGISILLKMQRINEELIQQIREMKNTDD